MNENKIKRMIGPNNEVLTWSAESILKIAQQCEAYQNFDLSIGLPAVPKTLLEWVLAVRQTIDGMENIIKFLPMYQQFYEDEWNWIMAKFGRQMTKSSYDASRLGFAATTKKNAKMVFVTHEVEALSVFSNEKFLEALWEESPIAAQYLESHAVGLFTTKINASIRLTTDNDNYKHVEGQSSDLTIFDEGNHQNLEQWVKAKEAQSFKHGAFVLTGIGGIKGTEYVKFWESTDKRKWLYRLKDWREKLEFRSSGHNRLVYGDYMLDICDGHWRPEAPENGARHGYHLSQYDAPWIPLKKSDAEKYGLPEDESIQWKLENYSQQDFAQHVKAEDIEGDEKPITEEMIQALIDTNISFISSDKVDKSLGKIYLGTDWGGGPKTVSWIWQCVNHHGPVFRLLYAEKANTDDVEEQYQIVKNLIQEYKVDRAVVDAGAGTHQVQSLTKYFGPKCLKNIYLTRPEKPLPDDEERKKFREENKFEIDKTYSLDNLITLIRNPYTAPNGQVTPRIIIPGADMKSIKWIVEQFTNEEAELVYLKSGKRQPYRRYFTKDPKTKPDDALHACNYAWIAWFIDKSSPDPAFFRVSK